MSSICFQIGDTERVFHIKSMWLKRVELVHPFKLFSVDVGWRDYLQDSEFEELVECIEGVVLAHIDRCWYRYQGAR